MRREIVVLVGILAVIAAVGIAVSIDAIGVPHAAPTGSPRVDGLLRVLLVMAVGAFAVSQTLISYRVLRLTRNRSANHDVRKEPEFRGGPIPGEAPAPAGGDGRAGPPRPVGEGRGEGTPATQWVPHPSPLPKEREPGLAYRNRRMPRNCPPLNDWANPAIEAIWTVIPTALVIGVGLYALLRR